ncbi:TPA: sigma-70 family RNA polymerase sigma factor [Streptococcus suis]|nr:sigma-70 family RNA polymerase sigma factor [Streptococcus suis]HEM4781278.1 sigma-70 family RNA polymerase sigma factor [Streptococcus suis]HEM4784009.1 sigma-70 family RNA polymerase sigma factor [Streptococcus suis]
MEYYLIVRGRKIFVDKKVYNGYWSLVNHQNYLRRREILFSVLPFSSFEKENFRLEDVLPDLTVDIEKIVETKIMLELLSESLSRLNKSEMLLIESIYFQEKTLRQVAEELKTSPCRISRLRDKVLNKLKNMLENSHKM